MTIKRADVVPSKFFKQCSRRDHSLHVFFGALGKFPGWFYVLE